MQSKFTNLPLVVTMRRKTDVILVYNDPLGGAARGDHGGTANAAGNRWNKINGSKGKKRQGM